MLLLLNLCLEKLSGHFCTCLGGLLCLLNPSIPSLELKFEIRDD